MMAGARFRTRDDKHETSIQLAEKILDCDGECLRTGGKGAS